MGDMDRQSQQVIAGTECGRSGVQPLLLPGAEHYLRLLIFDQAADNLQSDPPAASGHHIYPAAEAVTEMFHN